FSVALPVLRAFPTRRSSDLHQSFARLVGLYAAWVCRLSDLGLDSERSRHQLRRSSIGRTSQQKSPDPSEPDERKDEAKEIDDPGRPSHAWSKYQRGRHTRQPYEHQSTSV